MKGSEGKAPSRRRHRGSGAEPSALGNFCDFTMKLMHFWAYLGLCFCFKAYSNNNWRDKVSRMKLKFLYAMIIFIMTRMHYVASNITFFFSKNAEIICSVHKYRLPPTPSQHLQHALNIIRDLCCCKQSVYKVAEAHFFLFFPTSL